MKKVQFRRAVLDRQGQPSSAGTPGVDGGAASTRRGQRERRIALGDTRDSGASAPVVPELECDCLDMAVVHMQIDNIHLELDTQMHLAAQLETRMTEIEDTLHELIGLVERLHNAVWNKPGRREVLH